MFVVKNLRALLTFPKMTVVSEMLSKFIKEDADASSKVEVLAWPPVSHPSLAGFEMGLFQFGSCPPALT